VEKNEEMMNNAKDRTLHAFDHDSYGMIKQHTKFIVDELVRA
jgi:hypothetical protein